MFLSRKLECFVSLEYMKIVQYMKTTNLLSTYLQKHKTFYNPATGMCLASDSIEQVAVLKICNHDEDQKWMLAEKNFI